MSLTHIALIEARQDVFIQFNEIPSSSFDDFHISFTYSVFHLY